jgi:O-methyltransferase
MHELSQQTLNSIELLAAADGLAAQGFFESANVLYAQGAREARAPFLKLRFMVRQGLVARPGVETQALLRVAQALEALDPQVFVGAGIATWRKSHPFMEDARFVEIAERHADLLPLPNWHWNLQTVLWAVQDTADIPGDLVELGVFKGHTTRVVADYVDFAASPKTWWLYDTFEGIPQDQLDAGWENINEIYAGTFSYEEVQARFADLPNVRLVKGRVPEVLEEASPDAISFLHVDLNNTTAEIAALDRLYERLSPGAVVVFDDFGWRVSRAQHDAEVAWFSAKERRVLLLPTGQGVFVKR